MLKNNTSHLHTAAKVCCDFCSCGWQRWFQSNIFIQKANEPKKKKKKISATTVCLCWFSQALQIFINFSHFSAIQFGWNIFVELFFRCLVQNYFDSMCSNKGIVGICIFLQVNSFCLIFLFSGQPTHNMSDYLV